MLFALMAKIDQRIRQLLCQPRSIAGIERLPPEEKKHRDEQSKEKHRINASEINNDGKKTRSKNK